MPAVIIIMGVSGSGKSTIGAGLAKALDIPFYDADDFHPPANIEKMSKGIPLNDDDRLPWLKELARSIQLWEKENGAVLACSALKESYRELLNENSGQVEWIYLIGSFDLILNRMQQRTDHFMGAEMLQSQFDTLEVPNYGLQINIDQAPQQILETIIRKMETTKQASSIGVIGLAVMGKALSLNIADHNFSISVYNRTAPGEEQVVTDFLKANQQYSNLQGFTDLQQFVNSLAMPRKILMMIKSGPAIDMMAEQLLPYLSEGDIIIDGGNSFYKDTERRSKELLEKGIHFVGSGVSGGEEGARRGPSIMPGGTSHSYKAIGPILEAIAAKDANGQPCCTHVGTGGSGHFVKMIHNGIEYAEMQLLAEMYAFLSKSHSYEEIAAIFREWNEGELQSYLLEITSKILTHKEDGKYLLDLILDKAGNKGTGSWSTKVALELGYPNNMMSAAVFARYMSAFKANRVRWANKNAGQTEPTDTAISTLKNAYRAAQIINHHQGFEVIRQASIAYDWGLNLSEIARIWTNGCIIRSAFMKDCITIFSSEDQLLDSDQIYKAVSSYESDLGTIIKNGIDRRVPMPCFSNAYQYWVAMTTDRLPANLIQAQRDFFGAHTYQRIDQTEDQFFHTKWT